MVVIKDGGNKMDYYERKARAQSVIKRLVEAEFDLEVIQNVVEDNFQLSRKWTEKYYFRIFEEKSMEKIEKQPKKPKNNPKNEKNT
jgi:hypothetical protein